jgi:hypothetical protein
MSTGSYPKPSSRAKILIKRQLAYLGRTLCPTQLFNSKLSQIVKFFGMLCLSLSFQESAGFGVLLWVQVKLSLVSSNAPLTELQNGMRTSLSLNDELIYRRTVRALHLQSLE